MLPTIARAFFQVQRRHQLPLIFPPPRPGPPGPPPLVPRRPGPGAGLGPAARPGTPPGPLPGAVCGGGRAGAVHGRPVGAAGPCAVIGARRVRIHPGRVGASRAGARARAAAVARGARGAHGAWRAVAARGVLPALAVRPVAVADVVLAALVAADRPDGAVQPGLVVRVDARVAPEPVLGPALRVWVFAQLPAPQRTRSGRSRRRYSHVLAVAVSGPVGPVLAGIPSGR